MTSASRCSQKARPWIAFFLLLDGHLRVQRSTAQGDEIILLYFAPGQSLGIGAALGHKNYPATAVAAEEWFVLAWLNRL